MRNQLLPVVIDLETVPTQWSVSELAALEQEFNEKHPADPKYAWVSDPDNPTPTDVFRFENDYYVPHKTLKDSAKMDAYLERKTKEFFTEASLHNDKQEALFKEFMDKRSWKAGGMQVVSWAGALAGGEGIEGVVSDDEEKIAISLREFLSECGHFKLVGYNISGFDLPVLTELLAKHGQRLTHKLGKWDTVDLYYEAGKRGKLEQVAKAYGIVVDEDKLGGENVAKAFYDGELDEILRYNKQDVAVTTELYLRIRGVKDI